MDVLDIKNFRPKSGDLKNHHMAGWYDMGGSGMSWIAWIRAQNAEEVEAHVPGGGLWWSLVPKDNACADCGKLSNGGMCSLDDRILSLVPDQSARFAIAN